MTTAKKTPSPCTGCQFTPKTPKPEPKPKPAPVEKTNLEIGLGAVEDFVKKGLNFFG